MKSRCESSASSWRQCSAARRSARRLPTSKCRIRRDRRRAAKHGLKQVEEPASNAPLAEVKEPNYQFGAMQRGTTKSHEFVFRNTGHSPLTLRVGSTTCKCTIGNVSDDQPFRPANR